MQRPCSACVLVAVLLAMAPAGVPGGRGHGRSAHPQVRIRGGRGVRLRGYAATRSIWSSRRERASSGWAPGIVEGLAFAAEANHLFLKPRAAGVDDQPDVLTNRRTYHFDYPASERRPDPRART